MSDPTQENASASVSSAAERLVAETAGQEASVNSKRNIYVALSLFLFVFSLFLMAAMISYLSGHETGTKSQQDRILAFQKYRREAYANGKINGIKIRVPLTYLKAMPQEIIYKGDVFRSEFHNGVTKTRYRDGRVSYEDIYPDILSMTLDMCDGEFGFNTEILNLDVLKRCGHVSMVSSDRLHRLFSATGDFDNKFYNIQFWGRSENSIFDQDCIFIDNHMGLRECLNINFWRYGTPVSPNTMVHLMYSGDGGNSALRYYYNNNVGGSLNHYFIIKGGVVVSAMYSYKLITQWKLVELWLRYKLEAFMFE